ncbi:hypothetical protein Pla111_31360 [Botrimarina hoheduenensis]|uniref:Uncharacterized protein n=1 Tax=Botrimarina hoheduenensis TaxID=2528000 RepID=A0A5C5VUY9_9BACT|nr:hypothetical protein Pla111_31360 [Botrimarina hoheduenensis]
MARDAFPDKSRPLDSYPLTCRLALAYPSNNQTEVTPWR